VKPRPSIAPVRVEASEDCIGNHYAMTVNTKNVHLAGGPHRNDAFKKPISIAGPLLTRKNNFSGGIPGPSLEAVRLQEWSLTVPVPRHAPRQVLLKDVDNATVTNILVTACELVQRFGADVRYRTSRLVDVIHLNTSSAHDEPRAIY
jgi:hypothetical protein